MYKDDLVQVGCETSKIAQVIVMAYIVMAYVVMTCIAMACIGMAYIVIANIAMAMRRQRSYRYYLWPV